MSYVPILDKFSDLKKINIGEETKIYVQLKRALQN